MLINFNVNTFEDYKDFNCKDKLLKNYKVSLGVKREIGRVNWNGFFTLYIKEVKRFTNVFLQTITAPMVTTLLFVIVFSIAIDRSAGFPRNSIHYFFSAWINYDERYSKCIC